MSKKEFIDYINNPKNELTDIKTKHTYTLQLSYKPKAILKRLEIVDNTVEYFLLTISDNGEEILTRFASNKTLFNKISDHLNFNMVNSIHLKLNDQKIKPLSCFHQATYGMADKTSILISFSIENGIPNKSLTIVLDEIGLDIGEQKFEINYNKIKELSNINLSEDEEPKTL
jgi:hypothetical protein